MFLEVMKASIIIVNWNTGELLKKCLDSLSRGFTNSEPYEVIVIDNDSEDESLKLAKENRDHVNFLKMKENLGFAKANNIGIEMAKGEYIILLNPDTEIKEGSFSKLIKVCERHPKAAAVGPKLLNGDGTIQESCRRFPTPLVLGLMFLKIHNFFPSLKIFKNYRMKDFSYNEEKKVNQIMGACMTIPKWAIERVGLLDDGYWIWFEEVDWCRSAYEKDYEIWFTPESEVVHYGGVSFKRVMPVKKEWRFIRSALRYVNKHFGVMTVLLMMPFVPLGLIMDSFNFLLWKRKTKI